MLREMRQLMLSVHNLHISEEKKKDLAAKYDRCSRLSSMLKSQREILASLKQGISYTREAIANIEEQHNTEMSGLLLACSEACETEITQATWVRADKIGTRIVGAEIQSPHIPTKIVIPKEKE